MKPRSRDAIIDAIEKAVIWAGAKDYDSGMAVFRNMLENFLIRHEPLRSREKFAETLDALPEPTWLQMRFMLGLFRYLPQVIRYGAREFARKVEEEVPPLPSGRPGLDAYTKTRIVAEISYKQLRGYNLKQAKTQTARQFNVHFSTVQRAWDDRGNRDEVDFRSVINCLADGGKVFDDSASSPHD